MKFYLPIENPETVSIEGLETSIRRYFSTFGLTNLALIITCTNELKVDITDRTKNDNALNIFYETVYPDSEYARGAFRMPLPKSAENKLLSFALENTTGSTVEYTYSAILECEVTDKIFNANLDAHAFSDGTITQNLKLCSTGFTFTNGTDNGKLVVTSRRTAFNFSSQIDGVASLADDYENICLYNNGTLKEQKCKITMYNTITKQVVFKNAHPVILPVVPLAPDRINASVSIQLDIPDETPNGIYTLEIYNEGSNTKQVLTNIEIRR